MYEEKHLMNRVQFIKRAKVIWQKVTVLDGAAVRKRYLVKIFYNIHQVRVRVETMVLGCIWDPLLGERKGRRGTAMVPLEGVMVVSCWFSIVTIVPFQTIWSQFAIECLRN